VTRPSRIKTALALFAAVLLSACATAPQVPVPLDVQNVSAKGARIGVVMATLPAVDIAYPGANCLLCLAAASAANSGLAAHTRTLPYDTLTELAADLAEALRKKGAAEVVVISDPLKLTDLPSASASGPSLARQDFTPLKAKYGVDKLLVVQVTQLGMVRTYSAYFPTSVPRAVFQGNGFIVDLTSNRYDWYLPVSRHKSADGKWDEPPRFPGLSNAYFQVIELARESYLRPFGDTSSGDQ